MSFGVRGLKPNQFNALVHECEQPQVNYQKIEGLIGKSEGNRRVCGLLSKKLYGQPQLLHIIKVIQNQFAELEQKGIKIFDSGSTDPKMQEQAAAYRARFQPYFKLAASLESAMKRERTNHAGLKAAYHQLQSSAVSLRYRLEGSNGGLNPLAEPDPACLSKLMQYAQEWKNKNNLLVNKELNVLDMKQLREAACYPEWVALLENREYRQEFFSWALDTNLPVNLFIKYDNTRRNLKVSLLSRPIGYAQSSTNEVLKVQQVATKVGGVAKKILTLPVYHGSFKAFEADKQKWVNIQKLDQKVHFEQGNLHTTVRDIFSLCAQKNEREVHINLSAWGLVNFDPRHGRKNADTQKFDDLPYESWSKDDWIDHVPAGRIVTQEELENQYGDQVKGKSFFFEVMGSRKRPNLDVLDCHGFWRLYVSMNNGQWKVLNIGPFAYRFQQGPLDGLMLFCNTVERVICLMDQNAFLPRQRFGYPIFPTDEQKQRFLDELFHLMISKGVFQFAGRNCAFYVQDIVKRIFPDSPNFFRMPVSKARTGLAPLDKLLIWADKRGEWLRWRFIALMHRVLGSWRELEVSEKQQLEGRIAEIQVRYSVGEFLDRNNHDIHNPAWLAEQIKRKQGLFAKGHLYGSHVDEQMARLKKQTASPAA